MSFKCSKWGLLLLGLEDYVCRLLDVRRGGPLVGDSGVRETIYVENVHQPFDLI